VHDELLMKVRNTRGNLNSLDVEMDAPSQYEGPGGVTTLARGAHQTLAIGDAGVVSKPTPKVAFRAPLVEQNRLPAVPKSYTIEGDDGWVASASGQC
jgi:hypothetical protein